MSNSDQFIPFSPPFLGQEEMDEVIDTLRSDWITTGPKVKRFEADFADFLGARAALALSSATDALQVGLATLGVSPGDEVITTPMTFCSTVHAIEHLGARPVLVDVEPDTLNIDPARVAAAITSRTKGILPVHLYGHPCEMSLLSELASRHELFILEDAAHALPARYQDRLIGSHEQRDIFPFPQLTAFSFYATKNMTTAEGGMLTGDLELIEKARPWSLHGMSRDAYKRYSAEGSWFYEVVLPGYKCNMTDIQAALGIQQLKKLPSFQRRRREIFSAYLAAFSDLAVLELPVERPEVESALHLFVIRLRPELATIDRDTFINRLTERGIGTSVHFIPIHLHPYYRDKYGYAPDDFPIAHREYRRMISLPLYPRLSETEVNRVIQAVRDVAQGATRG